MKKTVGFRLSEATRSRLSELSEAWGCTRTAVLERLLAEHGAKSELLGETRPDFKAQLPGDTAPNAEVHVKQKSLSSAVADPDKLAAFQRKMGKKK